MFFNHLNIFRRGYMPWSLLYQVDRCSFGNQGEHLGMGNNKRYFHSLSRQIALKLGLLQEYNLMHLIEEKKGGFCQYFSMSIFLLKHWAKMNAVDTCSPFLHASLRPIPTSVNNPLFTIHPPPTSQQFWEVLLFPCTVLPTRVERICSLQWEMASRSHWTSGVEKWRAFSYWRLPVSWIHMACWASSVRDLLAASSQASKRSTDLFPDALQPHEHSAAFRLTNSARELCSPRLCLCSPFPASAAFCVLDFC